MKKPEKPTDRLPDLDELQRSLPSPPKSVKAPFEEVAHELGSDTGEFPVTKNVLKKALRVNEIWTVLVAIATAGAALIGGYTLFIAKAEAAGAEAAAKVAKRQDAVEESQKEVREDVRALYRAVMYRQPQERLEKPLPKDGGP
jgi:hypothetical protein